MGSHVFTEQQRYVEELTERRNINQIFYFILFYFLGGEAKIHFLKINININFRRTIVDLMKTLKIDDSDIQIVAEFTTRSYSWLKLGKYSFNSTSNVYTFQS